MKRRYWLCKRSRIFYLYDSETLVPEPAVHDAQPAHVGEKGFEGIIIKNRDPINTLEFILLKLQEIFKQLTILPADRGVTQQHCFGFCVSLFQSHSTTKRFKYLS